MVVTISTFRPEALRLAQETGCVLIERVDLAEWVLAKQPQLAALL